ncbi:hypothetical protein GCM10020220_060300 [Nonomuraea rubra]|uniref:serine hydrolase domain-containing protein n=1 Tax=Nonomuraea rubra TaxID=46180 RepID=UPI0031EB186C
MSDRLEAVLADAVPRVCAAAVALIAADGSVVASAATGELVRYADAAGSLAQERPPAGPGSIFDLASVSKLFTTVVLLSLAEEGRLGLDEPVTGLIPGADPRITPRRLLTHTAGLPPTRRIDRELPGADAAARMDAMVRTPVTHTGRRAVPLQRRRHGDGGPDDRVAGGRAAGRAASGPPSPCRRRCRGTAAGRCG